MQESIQTTTMPPPQNPSSSTQEFESSKTTRHFQEPDYPFSSENPSESKNSKPDEESAQKSDKPEVNKRREVKEEEGTCAATVPTKSDGTVEDSGRERLKRHRVEVAGRVWIPDMWGQEDLLKDWIDCAAFDATLVNSSIELARDSLMGEGRRTTPTRLRIQNGF